MLIKYVFFLALAVIISVVSGVFLSKGIKDNITYLLFWLMYMTTLILIVAVILNFAFYKELLGKRGQVGPRGESGDPGEKGETGLCELGCRNKICTTQIMKDIQKYVTDLAGHPVEIKNMYIKEKVKQMCNSEEFKLLAPNRGPTALINYMSSLWKKWVKLIYDAGGEQYFKTIGAENEFEWLKDNPFNEIKKYDAFYWGLAKHYRPVIKNRCVHASPIERLSTPAGQPGHPDKGKDERVKGEGWLGIPRKNVRYTSMDYINLVPKGIVRHGQSGRKFNIKTTDNDKPNSYLLSEDDFGSCMYVPNGSTKVRSMKCNSANKKQEWVLQYTGNNKTELHIKNKQNNKYLAIKPLAKNSKNMIYLLVNNTNGSNYHNTLFNLVVN